MAVRRIGSARELVDAWELGLAEVPVRRRSPIPTLQALGDKMMTRIERAVTENPAGGWLRTGAWSAAGLLAGIALGIPAGQMAGLATMMLILPAVGSVMGLCLGTGQRLATRDRGALPSRWLLVSAAGRGVGLTGGTVLIELLDLSKGVWTHDLLALAVIGGSAGLALSLAQAWALEARSALKVWWVLGTALGFSLSFVAGGLAAYGLIGGFRGLAGLVVLALVASVAAGGATACILESVLARASGARAAA